MNVARKVVRRVRRAVAPPPRVTLLRRMPKNAVCAEIGVWKGAFSAQILEIARPAELHMIDPWTFQPEFPERMYGGTVAKRQEDMDAIYEAVRERYGSLPGVRIHRETSETALAGFEDGFFDWLYIDGNHYYEYVLRDLELAFRKVRPGGVIAGDDYGWGEAIGFPVAGAVRDAMARRQAAADRLEVLGSQFLIRR